MKLKEEYYSEIEKELFQYLKEIYFNPIFELLELPLYNSTNAVIDAINKCKIVIKDGVISGTFNIAISKELSKFADFDGRSKTFKIKNRSLIPNDIMATAMTANMKSKQMHDEINRRLQYMDSEARERFKSLKFSIDKSADQIESVLNQEYKQLGIIPTMTPTLKQTLIKQYNENMNLSIVDEMNPGQDWNTEQIERLRNMITKSATQGYNKKNLIDMIQSEFETTRNKAKFLARQETSIFLSTFREERFKTSGIKKYTWSTSHDGRVRHDHKHLDRQVFYYNDPPIVDVKTGRRANPGFDYNCRCVSIPIIE